MRKYVSRKFMLGATILIVATAIFVFTSGKLSGDNWVDLVKWTSGVYFIANAVSSRVKREG
jgi:hypothetical protein